MTGLFEDVVRKDFEVEFGNFEGRHFGEARIAGVKPAGVLVDEPHIRNAPCLEVLEFSRTALRRPSTERISIAISGGESGTDPGRVRRKTAMPGSRYRPSRSSSAFRYR